MLNTPPFLLGAILIFWGWQTDLLWAGAILAMILEGSRWVRERWEFSQADLDRLWNFCVLLFVGSLVLALSTGDHAGTIPAGVRPNSLAARAEMLNRSARSLMSIFTWLPLTLAPIVLAQAFSRHERMDWSTFSWWLRRQRGQPYANFGSLSGAGVNVGYLYFVVCFLAASAASQRTTLFPVLLALLAGWALYAQRSRGFKVVTWGTFLLLVLALALAAQVGVREVQRLSRRLDSALINRLAGVRDVENKELRTRLGAVGRIKLSGAILMRVETDKQQPPALLREASYRVFRAPQWNSLRQEFGILAPEDDQTTWNLFAGTQPTRSVTISSYLSGGAGLLALPQGTARLEELPGVLETNRLGVVRVTAGPGFVRYQAFYDDGPSIDAAPDLFDLDVPIGEAGVLNRVVTELGLRQQSSEQKLQTLRNYFLNQFQYSLWQGRDQRPATNETALGAFLHRTKRGHCEYFATATVLLLREAGVSARYATGYAVEEKKGRFWVVRGRHAHAWCLAWINGAWRNVDNTPPSWVKTEAHQASLWEIVTDFGSRLWFEFSKWRWGKGEWKGYLIWLAIPLLALTAWRLFSQKQWKRSREIKTAAIARPIWPGADSEFYQIVAALEQPGRERAAGESLAAWLQRLAGDGSVRGDSSTLRGLLSLHYRFRFDPSGLSDGERESLKQQTAVWLMERVRSGNPGPRSRAGVC